MVRMRRERLIAKACRLVLYNLLEHVRRGRNARLNRSGSVLSSSTRWRGYTVPPHGPVGSCTGQIHGVNSPSHSSRLLLSRFPSFQPFDPATSLFRPVERTAINLCRVPCSTTATLKSRDREAADRNPVSTTKNRPKKSRILTRLLVDYPHRWVFMVSPRLKAILSKDKMLLLCLWNGSVVSGYLPASE